MWKQPEEIDHSLISKETNTLLSTDPVKLYEIFKYITLLSLETGEHIEEPVIEELFEISTIIYQNWIKSIKKDNKDFVRMLLKRLINSIEIYKDVYQNNKIKPKEQQEIYL